MTDDPTIPALQCRAVAKDHGEGRGLAPLDLTISRGERVVLIGRNGSGKTTLMRLVAGLAEPTAGRVDIFGIPAGSLAARAQVAYVGDEPSFYDDLSLREHLRYLTALYGATVTDDDVTRILQKWGLLSRADDLPTHFSRGLRQKAALALASARPCTVLLIDEPFVGLDPTGRKVLIDFIAQASLAGTTVLIATHDHELAATTSRILALADGVVVHDGPIEDPRRFMSSL